jgi:hypothetical protein
VHHDDHLLIDITNVRGLITVCGCIPKTMGRNWWKIDERSTAFAGSQSMSQRQEWDLAQGIPSQSALIVLSVHLRVKSRDAR